MTMYMKVTPSVFSKLFEEDDLRKGSFTYSGAEALLRFFEDSGTDLLFDKIALALGWVEIEDADSLLEKYSYLVEDREPGSKEELAEALLDELERETTVLKTKTGGFVVATF